MEVPGRTFLVTGGGSGLGLATARVLAGAGASVVAADLRGEPAAGIRFVETDVTDEESVGAAVEAALESGPLYGVVNCAGVAIAEKAVGRDGPHSLESFKRVIGVNLIGTFNVLRLAAAAMAATEPVEDGERGVVVNTASIAAFDGQIGQLAYSASKGGVVGMTLPIARDLARDGIRVCTIAPGTFDTPLLAGLPEPARDALGRQIPHPSRLGDPHEFALLACHIAENPMLNGETIRLDGALRMPPR